MRFEVGGGEHIAVAGVDFVAHYTELSLGEEIQRCRQNQFRRGVRILSREDFGDLVFLGERFVKC